MLKNAPEAEATFSVNCHSAGWEKYLPRLKPVRPLVSAIAIFVKRFACLRTEDDTLSTDNEYEFPPSPAPLIQMKCEPCGRDNLRRSRGPWCLNLGKPLVAEWDELK